MFTNLQIDPDPTIWYLAKATDASTLTASGETVVVDVTSPLKGTMLLSRKAAAGLALFTQFSAEGSVPHDIRLARPVLYLTSSAGPQTGNPGYELSPDADLNALTSTIQAAMEQGQSVTIPYLGGLTDGQLVLNGAVLPFVVLCPVTPAVEGSVPHDLQPRISS